MTVRLLAFAASLRAGSWNRRLVETAAGLARGAGAEVDLALFREFDMPLYDADLEAASGWPAGTRALAGRIEAADGLLIASPEYNYSIPGPLKNAIDWLSRVRPMPLRGRTALLLSASRGQIGGIRGLWQVRIPLEGLGVHVYPDMFALPWAERQFDEQGNLAEPDRQERLQKLVAGFLRVTAAIAGTRGGSGSA